MRRAGRREKARVYSDPVVGRIVNHSTVLFAMDPAFGLLMADRRSSRAGPSLEQLVLVECSQSSARSSTG